MHSSAVHAHRISNPPASTQLASSRIGEMLDQVKNEYESAVQQLNMTKMAQIEAERKLQAQVVEMDQIQQTLKTLEANHRRIRQQYEEDIMRMRRQFEGQQGAGVGVKLPGKRHHTPPPMPMISGNGVKEDQPFNSSARVPVTLRPLENQSKTPTSRSADLIPPLRSSISSKRNEQRALPPSSSTHSPSESPVLKKPKTKGDSIKNLSNANSVLPLVNRADKGSGTESSPVREANTKPDAGVFTNKSKVLGGSSTVSASTSSSSTGRKHNWNCTYGDHQSERPVVEMYKTMDHQSVVCSVQISADGTMMATGCHKTTRVFDIKSGECKFASAPSRYGRVSTNDDAAYVRAVAFSPDSTKLVAGMPHNTIRVWDIATSEEGPAMTGHEAPVYGIDYVSNTIASGSGDGTLRLWDARTGQCKKIFGSESGGPSDGVTSVALSPDGRYLAAGSLDKVVRIWDTESSQLLDRFEGHSDSVYSIAFSPDGKNLVSGAQDHNIMLWDVNAQGRTSSRPRMVFQGHKDFVLSVAYSPDGRLMSGSKDRSVVFWDPRSSRSLLTLTGYRNSVISVTSSPASPYFATGSGDCLAVVWKYGGTP